MTVHAASFRSDATFRSAYARGVQASNGVDPGFEWRVHVALWAAETSLRVQGDFVECGVNAGFISSAIMHRLDWNRIGRQFYLVDTFAGPVLAQYSQTEIDASRVAIALEAIKAGAYVTNIERVRANFSEWKDAVVIQGAVPDILPELGVGRVAFLHLDMNCAFPERSALEFFWDRLSTGALVLLDDYAAFGHGCQQTAIDDVARRFGVPVLSLPTGQGLIIR